MLDVALKFLERELNGYFFHRTGSTEVKVKAGQVVDDAGKWAMAENQVCATVVQVEEERTLKAQRPEAALSAGRQVSLEPELRLNLHVLFCARFQQYDQAMLYLSHLLTFFQSHTAFTPERYPDLDGRVRKLSAELLPLGYEQLNQLWAFVGAKHLPSVVYRLRMLSVQDPQPLAVAPAIGDLATEIKTS